MVVVRIRLGTYGDEELHFGEVVRSSELSIVEDDGLSWKKDQERFTVRVGG